MSFSAENVCQKLEEAIHHYFSATHTGSTISEEDMREAFAYANGEILKLSQEHTTPVAISILIIACNTLQTPNLPMSISSNIVVGLVGDIKLYRIKDHHATCILYDPLIDTHKKITDSHERTLNLKNAIGVKDLIKVQTATIKDKEIQQYLVASHIAYHFVNEKQMLELAKSDNISESVNTIFRQIGAQEPIILAKLIKEKPNGTFIPLQKSKSIYKSIANIFKIESLKKTEEGKTVFNYQITEKLQGLRKKYKNITLFLSFALIGFLIGLAYHHVLLKPPSPSFNPIVQTEPPPAKTSQPELVEQLEKASQEIELLKQELVQLEEKLQLDKNRAIDYSLNTPFSDSPSELTRKNQPLGEWIGAHTNLLPIEQLSQQIDELSWQLEQEKSKYVDLFQEKQSLANQLAVLSEKLDLSEENSAFLPETVEMIPVSSVELDEVSESDLQHPSVLSALLEKKNTRIQELEANYQQLSEEIEIAMTHLKKANVAYNTEATDSHALTKEVEYLITQYNEQEKASQHFSEELNQAKTSLVSIANEKSSLEETLSKQNHEIELLEATLKEEKLKKQKQETEFHHLLTSLEKQKTALSAMMRSRDELLSELNSIRQSYQELNHQKAHMEKEGISYTTTMQLVTPKTHVVQAGESLTSIAMKYYGSSNQWKMIFNANQGILKDKDNLQVGQNLIIP